jgi:hypothetical protein
MTDMSLQVAKEAREKFAEMVSFWHKPSTVRTFEARCRMNHVEKSEVFRALVDLFLFDYEIEKRIMDLVNLNHV